MNANPEFTVHLKRGLTADVSAAAEEITNEDERAKVLYRILTASWDNEPAKADHILPRWHRTSITTQQNCRFEGGVVLVHVRHIRVWNLLSPLRQADREVRRST